MDFLTPGQRSERMSRIRSRDTGPELALRHALHRLGLRYRLRNRHLPGNPDLVFPRYHAVVFVHGCFWHRHVGCKVANTPKSNTEFWAAKFERNVKRDAKVAWELAALGWRVFLVWECELHTKAGLQATAGRIARGILAAKGEA